MEKQWQTKLIQNVTSILTKKVEVWSEILEKLGIESINLCEYTEAVERNTAQLYDAMIAELEKELIDVTQDIQELLQKSEKLCKQLSIDMPCYGQEQEHLSLFQQHRLLKEQVMKQHVMVEERLAEINKLNEEEVQLCASLGYPAQPIFVNPLPNSDEVKEFANRIRSLKEERLLRYTTYTKLRDEIITIAAELELKPSLQFGQMVFAGGDDFALTSANMNQLRDYHTKLVEKQQSEVSEVESVRNKIEDAWKILDIDIKERDLFRQKHVGHSLETLIALKEELGRCEEKKAANIKTFIDKLRQNLIDMWNKLFYTEPQREEFIYFGSNLYTEELLEFHEKELLKLERLYNHHKELFTSLEKHKRLRHKLIELETKANQPDRIKNRGGQLLLEEKERNKLSKQITTIEVKLRELAASYKHETGKQFLCWGESVEEYINKFYAKKAEERKMKLSARKEQHGNLKLTPAKSAACLFSPGTHTTPRQAPVRPASCNKRKQTPHTTEKNARLAVAKPGAAVDDDGLQLPVSEMLKKKTPQKTEHHLQPTTSASKKFA